MNSRQPAYCSTAHFVEWERKPGANFRGLLYESEDEKASAKCDICFVNPSLFWRRVL
ncbi:hypothetical protein SAMN04488072_11910 [Lentibacillus halodurans]|uniref:Uncharacterized protein n=1 Tax=Lentibacillus halodurans TaxID=237679 RepID=A0A1I1ADD3_9BACI|nr:hypothetical protein SAMN04488072_11910 [Lentibacillus halodurans]